MEEKITRNQKIYDLWKEEQTKPIKRRLSFAKIGKIYKRKIDGVWKPIDASAIYRIVKRYEKLELDEMKEKENQ